MPGPAASVTLRVYSDSQSAVNACHKHNSCSRTVKKVKAKATILGSRGYNVTIRWTLGHQVIPCNEADHEAARELLPSRILDPRHQQTLNQTSILSRGRTGVFDYEKTAILAKAERRAVLRNYIPVDDDPLPSCLSRWAAVWFCGIRTDVAITPVVLARFNCSRTNQQEHKDISQEDSFKTCQSCSAATCTPALQLPEPAPNTESSSDQAPTAIEASSTLGLDPSNRSTAPP